MDLEGIVAKHSFGPYTTERERSTWFKIENRIYSQLEGREELFERERHRNQLPAGIVVNWLVQRWNNELPD